TRVVEGDGLHQEARFRELIHRLEAIPLEMNSPMAIFREECIAEVREAQDSIKVKSLVENTFHKCQRLVEEGQFDEAKLIVEALPDQPQELIAIKSHWLDSIFEAKTHKELHILLKEAARRMDD